MTLLDPARRLLRYHRQNVFADCEAEGGMSALFTLKMLTDAKACEKQVDLFRATFGDSVNVTVARAKKVAGLFNWEFAVRFLDDEGAAEYRAAKAPHRAAYG